MDRDAKSGEQGYALPSYLRFARSLALLSSVAIGVGAGVTVFTSAGCQVCNGAPCGDQPPPSFSDAGPVDHGPSMDGAPDGSEAADAEIPDAGAGGGPRLSPPAPAGWLA